MRPQKLANGLTTMANTIKFTLGIVATFLVTIVYSCAVIASRTDEQLEMHYREQEENKE